MIPNPLAPEVPGHFGEFRRAALLTSQKGWCAVCDEQPIPLSETPNATRRRKGARYTCRRPLCLQIWNRWCSLECQRQRRALKKKREARP